MDNEQNEDAKCSPWAFPSKTDTHYHMGLTRREWFAGMALQGILAHETSPFGDGARNPYKDSAVKAMRYTYALLAELSAKEGK